MIWVILFEEQYINIFNDNNEFRPFIKSWKKISYDMHVVWSGRNEALDSVSGY